jgi:hypothetical protein
VRGGEGEGRGGGRGPGEGKGGQAKVGLASLCWGIASVSEIL